MLSLSNYQLTDALSVLCIDFFSTSIFCLAIRVFKMLSAYHLYGNFGEKFPSNGTGIFLGTENRNRIELYHLQNTGKFFAFSRNEAWV